MAKTRRPLLATVRDRHHQVVRDGRPAYLDIYDDIHSSGIHPIECEGAMGPCCGQRNYCMYCHERYTRRMALRTLLTHAGQPNIHAIRIDLDAWGGLHPGHAREFYHRVQRTLRSYGFTRQSLFLHPYGANPFAGVRSHIDGIVAGWDADPDALDLTQPGGLARIMKRFQAQQGQAKAARIQVHRLHSHSRKQIAPLLEHAMQAARPSWRVRAIHAGLYTERDGTRLCRLTDAHDKSRPTHIKDLHEATRDDLVTAAVMADEWDRLLAPPKSLGVRVEPHVMDLILEATPWRSQWKLPADRRLRARYVTKPSR